MSQRVITGSYFCGHSPQEPGPSEKSALSQIQTEVDPVRKEYYGFTDKIRELEESGLSWVLPLKN